VPGIDLDGIVTRRSLADADSIRDRLPQGTYSSGWTRRLAAMRS